MEVLNLLKEKNEMKLKKGKGSILNFIFYTELDIIVFLDPIHSDVCFMF